MVYYGLKVIAGGQDCARGRCIKTTTKLLERALRLAPLVRGARTVAHGSEGAADEKTYRGVAVYTRRVYADR
jgi:hypothetical protein